MLKELILCARLSSYWAARTLLAGIALFVLAVLFILAVLRFVNPPGSAVMLRDYLAGARVQHQWLAIERISPNLIRAVINSEDARFCMHNGIDFREFRRALKTAETKGIAAVRGASTITMQVAKNLFLWTERDLGRKALELAITPLLELMWPKRRILEVYLNIAQWGPGLFGVRVAARAHFGRDAIDLTARQAALLAASLPAPSRRRAGAAGAQTRRIARRLERRMQADAAPTGCVS